VHTSEEIVEIPGGDSDTYSGTAVRKAIVLTRYVNLIKHWIADTNTQAYPAVTKETGILPPNKKPESENASKDVSPHYRDMFKIFLDHLYQEADALDDQKLVSDCGRILSANICYTSHSIIQSSFEKLIPNGDITTDEAIQKVGQDVGITLSEKKKHSSCHKTSAKICKRQG